MINQLFKGDCLDVLTQCPAASVDLVYLDPPFFTQKTHSLKSRDREEYLFEDSWQDMADYMSFLKARFLQIKRVMKDEAGIFVHCDRNAAHTIRVLLDEIFGYEHFIAEIIWTYKRWSNSKRGLLNTHQNIYWYAKTPHYTFVPTWEDYSETTNLDQIYQKRERDKNGKTIYARDENGQVVHHGPKQGVPLSDTWAIPYLNPKAKERTGYPTQKPLILLERIIQLASHEGSLVLDPFCGSGTTLVAAQLLGRNYMGIDISDEAIALSQKRLLEPIKTESRVLEVGRASYQELPEYVRSILANLPVKIVQRNAGIDAIYNQYIEGCPVVLRVQRHHENLYEAAALLQRAGQKMSAQKMILIQIESANSLFHTENLPPNVQIISSTEYNFQQLLSVLEK